MTWESRYIPPQTKRWQGREDAPKAAYFFQIIQLLNLQHTISTPNQLAFALIGFCCDEGIRRNLGRVGASAGPNAIREMLAKLAVNRQDFMCYDAGDMTCMDGNLEAAQFALSDVINLLLQKNIIPIVLGGGHELAFGNYQGIAKHFSQENLSIINLDAHFDMRPILPNEQGSSGTPFLQIATAHEKAKRRFDYNCIGIQHSATTYSLLKTAEKFHTNILYADELQDTTKSTAFIDRILKQNQLIYLSICLDVFAAPFAPGVSAPQPLGLIPHQIVPLVRQIAASKKVVSYDIAELSPQYDIDQRTAKLAAALIYEIIHHHRD